MWHCWHPVISVEKQPCGTIGTLSLAWRNSHVALLAPGHYRGETAISHMALLAPGH
jgi:hypothetical protein